ncbi:GerAB/ArcD/ProY family transporter [Cytobacillus massiliigabonensis]|uniref:GerAB/ArcD/ProY family transporter n=1 Tax=Cytobacillus massiliigabonensis TaxID=1871011 RepID=UPI000C84EE5E|nr:endospore germination permease [Cytobacillus massiliigabonensis]
MEKGKISSLQMGMMMYLTIMASAVFTVPAITAKYAKQDLWLSPIWASLIGLLTIFIVMRLYKHYPQQSFFRVCEHTAGLYIGKLLGFVYVCFLVNFTGQIIRGYADFILGVYFPKTPISVIIISITILSALTVIGGLEVIGRVSQIFFPVFIFSIFIITLLLLPQLNPSHLLPIMEDGIFPSLKGAIIPQVWFGEFFIIIFILPFLSDQNNGMKWGLLTIFMVLLTFITVNLIVLFTLGQTISGTLYPFLNATRLINLGDFIENLEPIIIAIWILGSFVKITVFYYVTALGIEEWLKLTDYKPIVWPLGILLI